MLFLFPVQLFKQFQHIWMRSRKLQMLPPTQEVNYTVMHKSVKSQISFKQFCVLRTYDVFHKIFHLAQKYFSFNSCLLKTFLAKWVNSMKRNTIFSAKNNSFFINFLDYICKYHEIIIKIEENYHQILTPISVKTLPNPRIFGINSKKVELFGGIQTVEKSWTQI